MDFVRTTLNTKSKNENSRKSRKSKKRNTSGKVYVNYFFNETGINELIQLHNSYLNTKNDKSVINKFHESIVKTLETLKEHMGKKLYIECSFKNNSLEIIMNKSFEDLLVYLQPYLILCTEINIDNSNSKCNLSLNTILTNNAEYKGNLDKHTKMKMLAFVSGFAYGRIDQIRKQHEFSSDNKSPYVLNSEYFRTPTMI
jgi:hypothetical protein